MECIDKIGEKKLAADNAEVSVTAGLGVAESAPDNERVPDMTPMTFDPCYKTVIILERHGESLGNAERTYHGHSQIGLSERGVIQAKRSAEYLANLKIDAIYSSDLKRAYDTAAEHLAYHKEPKIVPRECLREVNIGRWQGMKIVDIIEQYGEYFTVEWKEQFGTFRGAPEGESVPDAANRFFAALLEVAKECEGKTVLVASHAAVIRAAYAKIKGIAPERVAAELPFPNNASFTVVYFDGERLVPGEFSHDGHLADT